MQGASSTEERLAFTWIPVLVWKVRPDETLQAICHGWSKSVYLTKDRELHEEYVYDFYYDQPIKQDKELSFDNWIRGVYHDDHPYLNNSLWDWIH